MSHQSNLVRKARFRVMFKVVAAGESPVSGQKWYDYFGFSRTYMDACERASQLQDQESLVQKSGRLYRYVYKVCHEKFVVDGIGVGI